MTEVLYQNRYASLDKVVESCTGLLAITTKVGKIFVFDRTTLQTEVFDQHTQPISSVSFSPNGELIASVDASGILFVWTARRVRVERKSFVSSTSPTFWIDNSRLLIGLVRNRTIVINIVTGEHEAEFSFKIPRHRCISEDKKTIAYCTNQQLELVTLETKHRIVFDYNHVNFDFLQCPKKIRFLDKDQLILTSNQSLSIFSVSLARTLRSFPIDPTGLFGGIIHDISNDGSCIVTTNRHTLGNRISMYDIASGKKIVDFVQPYDLYRDHFTMAMFSRSDKEVFFLDRDNVRSMPTPEIVLMEMQQAIEDKKSNV